MTMALKEKPYYDTHTAIRQLTDAGWSEHQAESLVQEQMDFMEHNLATKTDIEKLHLKTNAKIESVQGEIEKLHLKTDVKIESVRGEIESVRGDIKELRQETKADLLSAKNDLTRWMIATNFTLMALMVAVVKLF